MTYRMRFKNEDVDLIENDLVEEGVIHVIDRRETFGESYDPEKHGTPKAWVTRDPRKVLEALADHITSVERR